MLHLLLLFTLLTTQLPGMNFEEWKQYRHTDAYKLEQKKIQEKKERTNEFKTTIKKHQSDTTRHAPPKPKTAPLITKKDVIPKKKTTPKKKTPAQKNITTESKFTIHDINKVLPQNTKTAIERILEKQYEFHSNHFNLTKPVKVPMRIIASHQEYLAYLAKLGVRNPNETAGIFIKRTKETIVYQRPGYYSSVIHEAQHYLMNTQFQDAPLWLNEGFSEFYERAYIQKDGIFVSQSELQKNQIAKWLRSGDKRLIRNVVTIPDREWWTLHKGPEYKSRVVSWSIVYFFMSTEENRRTFSKIIEALSDKNASTLKVLNTHYKGGINRFERDWFAFFKNVPPTIKL